MTVCVARGEISQLDRSTVQGYVECNAVVKRSVGGQWMLASGGRRPGGRGGLVDAGVSAGRK